MKSLNSLILCVIASLLTIQGISQTITFPPNTPKFEKIFVNMADVAISPKDGSVYAVNRA